MWRSRLKIQIPSLAASVCRKQQVTVGSILSADLCSRLVKLRKIKRHWKIKEVRLSALLSEAGMKASPTTGNYGRRVDNPGPWYTVLWAGELLKCQILTFSLIHPWIYFLLRCGRVSRAAQPSNSRAAPLPKGPWNVSEPAEKKIPSVSSGPQNHVTWYLTVAAIFVCNLILVSIKIMSTVHIYLVLPESDTHQKLLWLVVGNANQALIAFLHGPVGP